MPKVIDYTPGQRPVRFKTIEEANDYLNLELIPCIKQLVEIANERSNYLIENSSASVTWEIENDGDLTVVQSTGPTLLVNLPLNSSTMRLRNGRFWTLSVRNESGGAIDVSLDPNILANSPVNVVDGATATWTFVKSYDEEGLPRLTHV